MRTLLLLTATTLLSTPAWAQLLPQTDVEGSGTSTQTLSLVGGAVNVTLDAGGGFDTRDGSAAGGISLDVNGIGVGLQTPGYSSAASGAVQPAASGSPAAPVTAAASAAPSGAGAPTLGEAPNSTTAEATTTGEVRGLSAEAATLDGAEACGAAGGAPLRAQEIGALAAGTAILLERGCSGGAASPAVAEAVASNRSLAHYLAERGIAPDQVVSASAQDGVVRLRYVAADG